MARLATVGVGALLMVLLAIAQASTYRTIVTTTEINDQEESRSQCVQQIQRMRIEPCLSVLQPVTLIPQMGQTRQCCNELQKVGHQCVCEAVQQIVQAVRQFQGQGGVGEQVMQKAQDLPKKCGFRQECQIRQDEY